MKLRYLYVIGVPAIVICTLAYLVVWPAKTHTVFPRVVQNGCGKFSVQMDTVMPFGDSKGYMYYIGVPSKYKQYQSCSGIVLFGTSAIMITTDCPTDTTNIEYIKTKRHFLIWVGIGDTVYDRRIGYELVFANKELALAAMNSYNRRTNEEKEFLDSIKKCHTYNTITQ